MWVWFRPSGKRSGGRQTVQVTFQHLSNCRIIPADGGVVFGYSATLLSAVTLVSAVPLNAQDVVKPRSPTDRLPKPASFSASQQPDGRIRVVWRVVEGAVRYKLIRSVPPAPSAPITLPNASDTHYVDTDVKPGSTYYYVVSAVNEAGIEGLRAGTNPVTATSVAPVDTARPLAPVPPPTEAVVQMYDYLRPQVSWKNSVSGARFIIERREDDGADPANVTWKEAVALVDKSWPCSSTCQIIEDPRPIRRNTTSQYRITTVEAPPSTRRSEPAVTNTVLVDLLPTAPPEIHDVRIVQGETHQLRYRPSDLKAVYASMDSNEVSVPRPGVLLAKVYGFTYVTAVSTEADGSIKMWIWRVWVAMKPQ